MTEKYDWSSRRSATAASKQSCSKAADQDHKGVNLPDTLLPIPALTPKDRADLDYALSLAIDWLGLSFVSVRTT